MADPLHSPDEHKFLVRQGPAGRNLTDSQFEEGWAVAGIIARENVKTGAFREKLSDYAHAFARTQRFDALKAEEIIRDIFKARYGQTMNEFRESLLSRETEIEPTIGGEALRRAQSIPERIREAPTMPFYLAYDEAAVAFASEYGITESCAKNMMKAAFMANEARELYEAGKEAESLYHKPAREEAAARAEQRPANRYRRQMSHD